MMLIKKASSFKKKFITSIIFILFVNYIEFEHVTAVRAPSPVDINKCCRIGEKLERNKQCSVGGTEQWWPVIYLIGKGAYFPKRGEAPRFLRVSEFKQPSCEHPELFINSIALFSNGSLFLGERNSFVDRNDYCVDEDVALVCMPSAKSADSLTASMKLTKIRKCCSLNSIYMTNAQNCVQQSEKPPNIFETKNASQIDLLYGFPICNGPAKSHNKYVIVEHFQESSLNIDNGTYTLEYTNKILKNTEFCIEHTNQSTNSFNAIIFACDDLVAVKEAPEIKTEEVRILVQVHTQLTLKS